MWMEVFMAKFMIYSKAFFEGKKGGGKNHSIQPLAKI
jgi:hypothetical protein